MSRTARGRSAVHDNIDARHLATVYSPLQGAFQFGWVGDIFTMSSQAPDGLIIRRESLSVQAIRRSGP